MNPHDGDPGHRPDDDPREAELGRLFALRERRDEAAAPGYERLLHRPARARAGGWRPAPARWALAGALLLVLAALGIVWRWTPGSPPPPGLSHPEAPTLATWKAPTDFLLAVPGGELLDSTPSFPDRQLPALSTLQSLPSDS